MSTLSPLARLRRRIAQLISEQATRDQLAGTVSAREGASSAAYTEASLIHETLRDRADEIEYRLRQVKIVRERDGDP